MLLLFVLFEVQLLLLMQFGLLLLLLLKWWKLAIPSRVPCGVDGRELVGVRHGVDPVSRCWTIFWHAERGEEREREKGVINQFRNRTILLDSPS